MRLIRGLKVLSIIASASSSPGCASARSRPAENAGPSPRISIARTPCDTARSRASLSSATIASFNAFILSGRLSTISARPFSIDNSTLIFVLPQSSLEHRDDVLGGDVADVDSLNIKFGNGGELDAPALDQLAHPRDRQPPVVGLLLVGEDSQPRIARSSQQDAMVVQKVARQIPELRRRLPQ